MLYKDSRFTYRPSNEHWKELNGVLRDLKYARDYALHRNCTNFVFLVM